MIIEVIITVIVNSSSSNNNNNNSNSISSNNSSSNDIYDDLTASSIAISQNGFKDILTLAKSTPDLSASTLTLTA
jgi:hypothetical protein